MQTHKSVTTVLLPFAAAFTEPTFARVIELFVGAILCRGRRTITRIIAALGLTPFHLSIFPSCRMDHQCVHWELSAFPYLLSKTSTPNNSNNDDTTNDSRVFERTCLPATLCRRIHGSDGSRTCTSPELGRRPLEFQNGTDFTTGRFNRIRQPRSGLVARFRCR